MMDENIVELHLNADQLYSELRDVDEKVQDITEDAHRKIDEVEDRTQDSFNAVMSMARSAWLTTRGVIRAAGGTVSSYFNLLIHTTFRTIEILAPLFTAKAAAGDYVQAAIGMANLALATSAAIAAQLDFNELASQLHGWTTALRGIGYMVGRSFSL